MTYFVDLFLSPTFDWNMFTAIGTISLAVFAIIAAYIALASWNLERFPIVHAVGTLIIATKNVDITKTDRKVLNARDFRDEYIFRQNSPHTLQLINIGRGPAQNIIPSVNKEIKGELLESICSSSFSLPAGKGTKELAEKLRVHGQCFVEGGKKFKSDIVIELVFNAKRTIGYFDIYFEDCYGKKYWTKVTIEKVPQVDDDELNKAIKDEKTGIEVWKVANNSKA